MFWRFDILLDNINHILYTTSLYILSSPSAVSIWQQAYYRDMLLGGSDRHTSPGQYSGDTLGISIQFSFNSRCLLSKVSNIYMIHSYGHTTCNSSYNQASIFQSQMEFFLNKLKIVWRLSFFHMQSSFNSVSFVQNRWHPKLTNYHTDAEIIWLPFSDNIFKCIFLNKKI